MLGSGGEEVPRDDAHRRARLIRPEYAGGELVRVAGGRHQVEAELIQNLLLEEGVPSLLRRSAGFDVPDFLAAGPRDVLVPAAGYEAARDVLLAAELTPAPVAPRPPTAALAGRLFVALAAGVATTSALAWALLRLAG